MANNIYTYQKNVTTSGTPVQLADQAVEQDQIVLVKAKSANTGTITLGYDATSANNGSASHFKLSAGQSIEIEVANTRQIWIDATVSGEGVEYIIGASAGAGSGGTSGATANQIQGNIASGATDSGNPIKVGGKYNATPPTLTSGQRGDFQIDSRGRLLTETKEFGVFSEVVVSVGTSSTVVRSANSSRKWIQIINDSDTVIYLSAANAPAVLNQGTRLAANGGMITWDKAVPTTTITAICSAAGKNLLVSEI